MDAGRKTAKDTLFSLLTPHFSLLTFFSLTFFPS
jgi:hypothetical protein